MYVPLEDAEDHKPRSSHASALVKMPGAGVLAAALFSGSLALWLCGTHLGVDSLSCSISDDAVVAAEEQPLAKAAVQRLDHYLAHSGSLATGRQRYRCTSQWLTTDFLFETGGGGFQDTHSLRDWIFISEPAFQGSFTEPEPLLAQNVLILGTDAVASTTGHGSVYWAKDLRGVPASRSRTLMRVADVYMAKRHDAKSAKIMWKFRLVDWADLLRRAGRQVLAPAPLPEGVVRPPAHSHGGLAALQSKSRVESAALAALQEDWSGSAAASHWHGNLTFYGPTGMGLALSKDEYVQHILAPYRSAFVERGVSAEILACEGCLCVASGQLTGRGVGNWMGLNVVGKRVSIPFVHHFRVEETGALVREGWLMIDHPALFQQLGLDFWALAAASEPHSL